MKWREQWALYSEIFGAMSAAFIFLIFFILFWIAVIGSICYTVSLLMLV